MERWGREGIEGRESIKEGCFRAYESRFIVQEPVRHPKVFGVSYLQILITSTCFHRTLTAAAACPEP